MMMVDTPKVHCKELEDNRGALELATLHKMQPRTKHPNINGHHFREAVNRGDITVYKIATEAQLADIFTKPLGEDPFEYLREKIMGW